MYKGRPKIQLRHLGSSSKIVFVELLTFTIGILVAVVSVKVLQPDSVFWR
jgi:hypothetical protein